MIFGILPGWTKAYTLALIVEMIGCASEAITKRKSNYRGSDDTLPGSGLGKYYKSWTGPIKHGSRQHSYYVTSSQPYRYSRHYSDMRLGLYEKYYRQYSDNSDRYSRMRKQENNADLVCVNYAANDNNTVMGVFACPLDFEPSFFTACCGDRYLEFCCEPRGPRSMWNWLWIVILAVLAFIGCVIAWRKEIRLNFSIYYHRVTRRAEPLSSHIYSRTQNKRSTNAALPMAAGPPAYCEFDIATVPSYLDMHPPPPPYQQDSTDVTTEDSLTCKPPAYTEPVNYT